MVSTATELQNVVSTCYGSEARARSRSHRPNWVPWDLTRAPAFAPPSPPAQVLKGLLPYLTEQLELCQKSLTAFLDTKRAEFPRFYFVSDPTLLEILSLGSDPAAVQPHFQSGLFDSLASVTFDKSDKTKMLEMHSSGGETVRFVKTASDKISLADSPVLAQGNIEVWLQALVAGMQTAVKAIIKARSGAGCGLALWGRAP